MRVGSTLRFDFLVSSRSWGRVMLESAVLALLVSFLMRGRELDPAWPALLAGAGWFLVRVLWPKPRALPNSALPVSLRAAQARHDDDTQLLERRDSGVVPAPGVALRRTSESAIGSTRSAGRPSFGSKTIVGLPVVSIPAAAADRSVSVSVDDDPRLRTRLIYHVGAVPWAADPHVLTAATLTQLRALVDELGPSEPGACKVIRVASSSNSRYAKSQVAVQLAWLLAERVNTRVLLMEADVDAPTLHRLTRVSVPRGMGLSEQLHALAERSHVDTITVMRLGPQLQALVEGRVETPGLFDSPEFTTVLAHQKGEHDVIVLDGPVVDAWPDVARLKHAVDGVVLVVASGTRLPEALKLAESHFDAALLLKVVKTGAWPDTRA